MAPRSPMEIASIAYLLNAYDQVIQDVTHIRDQWHSTADRCEREVESPSRPSEPLGLRVQRRDAAKRRVEQFGDIVDLLQHRVNQIERSLS